LGIGCDVGYDLKRQDKQRFALFGGRRPPISTAS